MFPRRERTQNVGEDVVVNLVLRVFRTWAFVLELVDRALERASRQLSQDRSTIPARAPLCLFEIEQFSVGQFSRKQ